MPTVTGHPTSNLTAEQLIQQLEQSLHSSTSGTLLIKGSAGETLGRMGFHAGKLLWAIAGQHRWRRWQRLSKQGAPNLDPATYSSLQLLAKGSSDHYSEEFEALTLLVQQHQVTVQAAALILQRSIQEAAFDLCQQANAIASVVAAPEGNPVESTPLVDELLRLQDSSNFLASASQSWKAWCSAGLASHSPDLAPVVRNASALQQRTSPQTYQTLSSLLNGQSTLRELAVFMKQDLQMLTKTLVAYTQWDLIGLNPIRDAPVALAVGPQSSAPIASPQVGLAQTVSSIPTVPSISSTASNSAAPLVLCIDDNLKVCEMLGKILMTAGYRYTSVQDSLQALPVLLEKKPDFIFLDLVMPVASGYEVCSQVRRISAFQEIPIVILTGNDGIIDRIRSKASGATDFISKPLDVQKVLSTLRHYLPDRIPTTPQAPT